MAMRIIGGVGRSLVLEVPAGLAVRPTAGRAREALFNSLGDLTGLTVFDLCAGSGALGLEAASRGAALVVMVERERRHCAAIERNVAALRKSGVETECRVVCGDVAAAAFQFQSSGADLIFSDPPYDRSIELFETLLGNRRFVQWAAGTKLVWEIPDVPGAVGPFLGRPAVTATVRKFGGTDFLVGRFQVS